MLSEDTGGGNEIEIAATKCRNKKGEKQQDLSLEGEVLEIQNASLKEEIKEIRCGEEISVTLVLPRTSMQS